MLNGPEMLLTIDRSLQQLRGELQSVDQQVQAASKHVIDLQQNAAQRFRDLAQFRMDRLLSDKVAAALDNVDERVATLLAARDEELAELEKRLSESQQLQTELERKRDAQRAQVNESIQTLDAAQAKTQKRLLEDAGYRERLEKARRADAVAQEAEAKTQRAEADRAAKGAAYEADPLFMYLWRRGYGTATYRANPLARFLDGWVARLCNFHDARPNYFMLLEIPTRLREHATKVRRSAQQQFNGLEEEEQAASAADGIPQLAANLHAAQQTLAELDAKIQEAETAYCQLAEQRAASLAGKDENFQRCLEAAAFHLEREPLFSLRQHAAATPSPKDDVLVEELGEFEHRKGEFTKSLARYQEIHGRHLARVRELEDVRRRFKKHDYDDYGSVFTNEKMIEAVLDEFLRGVASAEDLWGVLRGNQRRHRIATDPTFGSGGIPIELPGGGFELPGDIFRFPRGEVEFPNGGFRFPRGGSWRVPLPPAGGPWYGPRSDRTGGGVGGGGFTTTGGF